MRPIRTLVSLLAAFTLVGQMAAAAVITPRGAEVDGKLVTTLSSKNNHNGDTFTLTQTDTFFHHRPELKGSIIEGHLEGVTSAGPTHKATMSLIFDDIKMPDGSVLPVSLQVKDIKEFEPHTHHLRDVGLIVGGAVAGHILAKKTGTKGGTLAGVAGGFALATTLKSDITIKPGTIVHLKLLADLNSAN